MEIFLRTFLSASRERGHMPPGGQTRSPEPCLPVLTTSPLAFPRLAGKYSFPRNLPR